MEELESSLVQSIDFDLLHCSSPVPAVEFEDLPSSSSVDVYFEDVPEELPANLSVSLDVVFDTPLVVASHPQSRSTPKVRPVTPIVKPVAPKKRLLIDYSCKLASYIIAIVVKKVFLHYN